MALCLSVAVVTACAQQAGTASIGREPTALAVPASAALAPGDAIRLSVSLEPNLGGLFPVDEAGMVALPFLGTRKVTGLPASELKQRLLADYAGELRNQAVQITLLRRVRVLGAVKNPGLYHVDPTMTLADAIAQAGGASQDGKLRGVRILRGGREILSNVDGSALVAEQVRSGDQITVPERGWLSRNGPYVIGATISALGFIVSQALVR
ncbi:MAG: SLBB domain-containing protein [Gemmatimonadaceae bacterium]